MADMLHICTELDLDWIFELVNDSNPVPIPILFPISYQKQYIILGPQIKTEGLTQDDADECRNRVMLGVIDNISECLDLQRADSI
jgi:hypothetical protein